MIRSSARPLRHLLGQGVLTTTGEVHRGQRRALQPLFHRQHAAAWAEAIVQAAVRTGARLQDGSTIDMSEEMLGLSQAIIVKLLLNVDSTTNTGGLAPVLRELVDMVNRNTFPSLGELLLPFPSRRVRMLTRSMGDLDRILGGIITEHRAANGEGTDVLSAMLRMGDENTGTSMTSTEIRDQVVTFISAGHETVGNALTWTWYLLSKHPAIEAELHAEVDSVLGGRAPNVDDMPRLKFVEAVLKESMRIYPPVWVVARRSPEDFPLGEYVVPAGAYLQVSPYVTHRDERYFPAPLTFDPHRWTAVDAVRSERSVYLSFRRWRAQMHRREPGVDGRHPGDRDARAVVAVQLAAFESLAAARGRHHPQAPRRDADDDSPQGLRGDTVYSRCKMQNSNGTLLALFAFCILNTELRDLYK